jgi:hypothetical protein
MNSESNPRGKTPWYRVSRLTWELLIFGALLIVIGFLYLMNRSKQELFDVFAKTSLDRFEYDSKRDRDRLRDIRLTGILLSEETRKITLESSDRKTPHILAFVNMRLGIALVAPQIPQPAQHHTYQLWAFSRAQYTMNSDWGLFISKKEWLFAPEAGGNLLFLTGPPKEFHDVYAIAVTEEPEGGSSKPTRRDTWSGKIEPVPKTHTDQ